MRKILIVVLLWIVLFSCTTITISERLKSTLAPAANIGSSVSCQNGCIEEWERAQLWVTRHSKCKIQVSTGVFVQTITPGLEQNYGFTIWKDAAGEGNYVIRMQLFCDSPFGCDPKPLDVTSAFYYYVKTGIDLLQGQGYMSAIQ